MLCHNHGHNLVLIKSHHLNNPKKKIRRKVVDSLVCSKRNLRNLLKKRKRYSLNKWNNRFNQKFNHKFRKKLKKTLRLTSMPYWVPKVIRIFLWSVIQLQRCLVNIYGWFFESWNILISCLRLWALTFIGIPVLNQMACIALWHRQRLLRAYRSRHLTRLPSVALSFFNLWIHHIGLKRSFLQDLNFISI